MFKAISRMKPAPRFIIIALLVALPAWGVKAYLDSRPAKPVEAAAPVVEVTTVPAETAASNQVAPAPVVATPAQPAPVAPSPAPAPANDAGLNNLLK